MWRSAIHMVERGDGKALTMVTRRGNRDTNIHLRVHAADCELIDRAAEAIGKTRSGFVLDTTRREAEEVLRDQRVFQLDAAAWKTFMSELDRPPPDNKGLRDLMQHKAPWREC